MYSLVPLLILYVFPCISITIIYVFSCTTTSIELKFESSKAWLLKSEMPSESWRIEKQIDADQGVLCVTRYVGVMRHCSKNSDSDSCLDSNSTVYGVCVCVCHSCDDMSIRCHNIALLIPLSKPGIRPWGQCHDTFDLDATVATEGQRSVILHNIWFMQAVDWSSCNHLTVNTRMMASK